MTQSDSNVANTSTRRTPGSGESVTETALTRAAGFVKDEQPDPDIFNWIVRNLRGRIQALLFLGIALGVMLGAIMYFLTSPIFESTAIIRIAATQPFIMYEGNSMASRTFDAFVRSQVGMLSSAGLIEKSAAQLAAGDSGDNVSPLALKDQLSISESESVIKITATSDSAEEAVLYANTHLDTYLQAQRDQVRDRGSYRLRELTNRETELSQRLSEKNEEILALGAEYGLESVVLAHNDKLEMLQNSTRTIDELNRMILELETFGAAAGTGIADDVLLRELVEDHALDLMLWEHSKKLSELASLELRYQPTSRKVIELKASIEILEDAMAARREQIKALKMSGEIPADAASRQSRIVEMRDKVASLEPQRDELEEEARQLHAKTIRMRTLQEESSMLTEFLDETQRALERVRLESRLDVSGSVELVSRAPLPLQPVNDKRKLLAAAGVAAGILVVFGAFFAKAILQPRIRFTDDLEALDWETPVIGQLKSLTDESISGAVDMNVYRLRNNIQLADISPLDINRRAKVLAIGADSDDAQSSIIASQLSTSFSASKQKTLLVQTTSHEADANDQAGWHEFVVSGEAGTLMNRSGLHIMSVGSRNGIAETQLSLQQVRHAVADLSEDYDVIVFDIGTLGSSVSTDFVVSQCDLTLMTTRSGSPTAGLRRSLNHLKELVPNRIRLVLSAMSQLDPKFS